MARILLEYGANVNQQERWGSVPLLLAYRTNDIPVIDLFMEAGARLDIADADGIRPDNSYITYGPQVTAAMTRWIRKRNGEQVFGEENMWQVWQEADFCCHFEALR